MTSEILSPEAILRDAIPLFQTPTSFGRGSDFSAVRRAEFEASIASAEDRSAKLLAIEQIEARRRELIRDKLARDDLHSVGLLRGSQHEVIPAEFWNFAEIDFEAGTARHRNRMYTDIRVAAFQERHFIVPPGKKGRGRPAKRPLVREAALIALQDYDDFLDWPATAWTKEIHSILKNHPNFEDRREPPPEYETIRREINALRKERQARK